MKNLVLSLVQLEQQRRFSILYFLCLLCQEPFFSREAISRISLNYYNASSSSFLFAIFCTKKKRFYSCEKIGVTSTTLDGNCYFNLRLEKKGCAKEGGRQQASVMASLFRFKENDYLWPKLWLKKKNGRKSQILLRTLWHEKRVKNFFPLDY